MHETIRVHYTKRKQTRYNLINEHRANMLRRHRNRRHLRLSLICSRVQSFEYYLQYS